MYAAGEAAACGYAVAFAGVTLLGVAGCVLAARTEPVAVTPSTAASGDTSRTD
jgi:hypothetical protein